MSRQAKNADRNGHPRVGDRVRFNYVFDPVEGVIVEDRGPLGVGGRRLYRIKVEMTPADPMTLELPADQFTLVKNKPDR